MRLNFTAVRRLTVKRTVMIVDDSDNLWYGASNEDIDKEQNASL